MHEEFEHMTTISGTNGSDNITVSATTTSTTTVNTGNGNDTVTVNATASSTTINTGNGSDAVTVSGSGNTIITTGNGSDLVNLTASSGTNTVTAGNGSDAVLGGSGIDLITGGNGNDEFSALAVIRMLRRLTNRDFAPRRITFTHARNSGLKEIHRILRCPAEFAQTSDSLVLPQSVMALPIASGDSRLLRILEAHADDLLSDRHTAPGLRGQVENQLISLLPSGRVQTAVVAQELGMSTRSFTRHLAEEGTSFGEVLDRLRQRLALRYLEDQRNSLQQIAWLLGYSEIGAFYQAFKRWTGTSPGRARNLPAISS